MKQRLQKDAHRGGLYHLPAGRHRDWLEQALHEQQTILQADVGTCTSAPEILRKFGRAFKFPAWYGANLDALHDCLTDPDWYLGTGRTLLISGLDALAHSDPEAFTRLLDVLRSAIEIRSAEKQPLLILLGTPAPGVMELPVA